MEVRFLYRIANISVVDKQARVRILIIAAKLVQIGERIEAFRNRCFAAQIKPAELLITPGRAKWFGLLGREDDYILPWSCISRIGEDIILVELPADRPRRKHDKRAIF